MRLKRSDDTLSKASHHLLYEYSMLENIISNYFVVGRKEDWVTSVYLESLLIHLRNMLYFFYPKELKDNDIIAQDYFDGPLFWKRNSPSLTGDLRKAWFFIDKKVAHLTYDRIDKEIDQIGWVPAVIYKEIRKRMRIFLKHVPQDRLCKCRICQTLVNSQNELGVFS